ncbi:DUF418 domain-containing protein [Staphylococcus epidermidis]|nr:DUF418 domain-containing protein [Staphylococcus epidermidis]MCG1496365.1 DUF418 domain-containing protein [Staphylococcus epidermidis]MCG2022157.1 DUF418 domain-containing protein [Staphylococcus epidermidis]MCG2195743.1 DUF418 domain-containing protein [Staphylococcus epidermidis]MCG2398682.1 DUF418 domain-containing protein [Staphylococcus epidermidis]
MKQKRIVSLDIIRGLAIYLIVFMNSLEVFPRVAGESIIKTHTDAIIYNIEEVFIENKFIGLFSLLFGISMGIFMDNARRKSLSPLKLMFRRLLFLLIVGIITFMFLTPFFTYAIIGLIIMFVENLKKPKLTLSLLIIVSLSFIGISIYQSNLFHLTLTITLDMLLGLFLWQSGTISNFKKYKHQYLISLIIGFITIIIVGLNKKYFNIDKNLILYLITPLQTFIYFILLMFITQSQGVQQWLKPAEKVGKTAFTNFILQIVLLNLIIRIFFNSSCPTPSQSILISVITILIMSVLTMVWLKYFKQGPLEKIWRMWTYKNIQNK